MRPEWLSVPAAPRDLQSLPGCGGDVGERSGRFGSPVAAPQTVFQTRVVLVSVEAWCKDGCTDGYDDGHDPGIEAWTADALCAHRPPRHGHHAEPGADAHHRVGAGVDRVRLRGPAPAGATIAEPCRWAGAAGGPHCCNGRLDKHRLDVALSAGRHAAERAKLAGLGFLLGLAPRLDAGARGLLPFTGSAGQAAPPASTGSGCRVMRDCACLDPYAALGCVGHPEIAALVGVAIAGAQIGLPVSLPGPLGELVVRAALRLNPGVRGWLDVSLAQRSTRIRPEPSLATSDP